MGILRTDRLSGLGGANAIKGSVSFNNNLGDNLNGFLKINLDSNNRSNFDFDGDFTIECWVFKSKSTVSGDYDGLLYISDNWRFKWQQSDKIMYYDNGTDAQFMNYNTNEGFLDNNWHHLAIVRSSNTITGYVDGTSYGTASESGDFDPGSNSELLIGYNVHGFGGFISNLRVVKGTAVYTGNFTPPTSELTAIDGTVLLCCQSPGNVLQEATGNYVVESVVHPDATLNSKPPSSSHFTPNSPVIGTTAGFSTTTDVGTQFGSTFDGVTTFDSQAYFVPPGGRTAERNRGRGLWGGGWNSPSSTSTNNIDFIHIQSGGLAEDFGDLIAGGNQIRGVSSSTRGVFLGGRRPHPGVVNTMDFVTISTTANALDFGDLLTGRGAVGEISNQTRGIAAAGYNPGNTNVIEFITIATLGNSQDFGDTLSAGSAMAGTQSSTRGILAGNYAPSSPNTSNVIQFLTIATTGDAQDFGDLTDSRHSASGTSNGIRAVFAAGTHLSPGNNNTMDFVTIASTGNATDFGDLGSVSTGQVGATSDTIRGLFGGGSNSPLYLNVIQQVTIATTGNSVNIGDLTLARLQSGCVSDSHGGLTE